MPKDTVRAVLLVVAVVLSTVPPAVAAPTAASNADAFRSSADYAVSSDATVTRGETAKIRVTLPAGGNATLRVGDDDLNYVLETTVSDGDGDGEVVVSFDTVAAGTGETPVSAAGDDRITVQSETRIQQSWNRIPVLDAAHYPLSLRANDTLVAEGILDVRAARCRNGDSDRYSIPDVEVLSGESAEIPVSLPANHDATLHVVVPNSTDPLTATLTDGDGDGEVVVTLATSERTAESRLAVGGEADSLAVADSGSIDGDADSSGPYSIALRPGGDTSIACDAVARSRVTVRQLGNYSLPARSSATAGDTVEIPLTLPANGSADVRIEAPDSDHHLTVRADDGDGDGRVTVRFDTAKAGTEAELVSTASDADRAEVRGKSVPLDGAAFAAGTYDLTLRAHWSDFPDRKVAAATLVLAAEDESSDATDSNGSATDGPSPSVPGFGVGVAVVALLAGALVAGRRR